MLHTNELMRLFLLPLLLLLPALLRAQESRPIQCRFLSFGGVEIPPAVIAASEKGTETTCPLATSGYRGRRHEGTMAR